MNEKKQKEIVAKINELSEELKDASDAREIEDLEIRRQEAIHEYVEELGGYAVELGDMSKDANPLGLEGLIHVKDLERAEQMDDDLLKISYMPEICYEKINVRPDFRGGDESLYLSKTYHSYMPVLWDWEYPRAFDIDVLRYTHYEDVNERIKEGLKELGFEDYL